MRIMASSGQWRRWTVANGGDVAVVLGLSVAAYVLRRSTLPTDGLFYDDAWVAGGAVFGSIGDVAMTGGAHPGFTMLLWLQHQVLGGPVEHLAWFPFVVGVLGPAALYGCLRSLRYGRTGCFLAAAALVVTYSHIIYSGRVKSYTLDVVVVMGLAALLPRLADRRWTWRGVAGWVVAAVLIGSLSGYQMLASALAIGLLVLHARGDRWKRITALVVQGLLQGGWVLYTRRFVDLDEIEAFMETNYDGHVDRSWNPIVLGQNVFEHLERVVDVHPGAPGPVLGLVAVAVLIGLVLGAFGRLDRERVLVSQFALTALVVAAVGGVLHRFPFGPRAEDLSAALGAPGARHSLWLVPVTAVGLCNLIDLAVRVCARRPVAQLVIRSAVVFSTVLLVSSRWDREIPKIGGGAHALTRVTDDAADDGAFIVLDEISTFTYLLLSDRPVELVPAPEEMVGYVPVPDTSQGVVLGPVFTPEAVAEFLATTDRDLLVFTGVDVPYDPVLEDAGWEQVRTEQRGSSRVTVWRRGP